MGIFASTTTASYTVKGMTCEHCEMRVRNALQGVDGVKKVDVDRNTEQAVVKLRKNSQVSTDDLADAVEQAGYTLIR